MKNKIGAHLFSQEESKMNMSKNKTLNNNHYKEEINEELLLSADK